MEIIIPDEFKELYLTNAQRPVIKIPDPVLREVAQAVDEVDREVVELAQRMTEAMRLANGIGLAAPQVGVSKRVIVIAPAGNKPMVLINPVITSREGAILGQEGCLSIPGLYGDVERAATVEVEAYDLRGRQNGWVMEGLAARVVQHEVDHLEGVLFTDLVRVETLHWMHPDRCDEDE